ncbi:MAG: DUF4391 domain-containing protein [Bacteroidales bacterium]|nr:DUF4391 domain-containing protein [Bacteroidales bacterium]
MIAFPPSTYFGKRMPKEKFYAHLEVPNSIKQSFVSEMEQIVWKYKLSPATINLESGEKVKEIALLEVMLKTQDFNKQLFQFIDRNISVYVIYLLRFKSECRLLVNFKEPIPQRPNAFKVEECFLTDWMEEDKLVLNLEGLNLDALYESFVRQVAGERLSVSAPDVELKESITKAKAVQKIERKVTQLETRRRNEKQFNKQIEIAEQIKKLKELL